MNNQSTAALLQNIVETAKISDDVYQAFGGDRPFQKVLQSIEKIDSSANVNDHLFLRPANEDGGAAAAKFLDIAAQWDQGQRPSLPAVARAWIAQFHIDETSPEAHALMLVAARAEMVKGKPCAHAAKEEREPDYHDRVHTMQVFQSVCYLMKAQEELQEKQDAPSDVFLKNSMTPREIVTLMIAAMAHDIDHPGRKNASDPVTAKPIDYFNENIAAFSIRPILTGIYEEDEGTKIFTDVLRLIHYTDPNDPRRQATRTISSLRKEFAAAASGDKPGFLKTALAAGWRGLQSLLAGAKKAAAAPLPVNVPFWNSVALLCDADLLFSCAVGEKGYVAGAEKLTKEGRKAGLSLDFNTAASAKFFFDNIVGPEGMLSAPARALFNPSYRTMYARNEAKLALAA